MNVCCMSCKFGKWHDDGRLYPLKCTKGSQLSYTKEKAMNYKCNWWRSVNGRKQGEKVEQ